ncbi:threonine ammonia-lyase [Sphingobium boeckii]|uniref:Threonine dehydratase n=1 Tax=Sphingobium boeckii TaxID=1082345 RepID=A0A7W9EFD6_9SPHN|nr:pyridoxal-phosphate dependent enzyme [Sphingobium boeckii]MBB5687137.1 threonine dehydratase [Sphingobium boeckii]
MRKPTAQGVIEAAAKVAQIVPVTPLLPLETPAGTIWCKAESLQPMGAFKLRGAWHRLSALSAAERGAGVVAFSSGNHAQGVAWAASRLGMAATIVMPADAPRQKLESTRALGAEVLLYDRVTESREAIAGALAAERGSVLVPSFDDPWVIEGQGSAGTEAAAQMAALAGGAPDRIIIPCGGGGLAAGIALACPDAEIIVAEPEGWDDMTRSLEAGAIVPVGPNPPRTACDALQTLRVSPLTFDILNARGATGVAVSEDEIAEAMRVAFSQMRLVIEPGGAVALAAVLAGRVALTERTLVILSGGNVDPADYVRILEGGAG